MFSTVLSWFGFAVAESGEVNVDDFVVKNDDETAGKQVTRFVPEAGTDEIVRTELKTGGLWYASRVAFYLENIFSVQESQAIVDRAELEGFHQATVGAKEKAALDYRFSKRCILFDEKLAKEIWTRVQPHVPQLLPSRGNPDKKARVVGLNEKFSIMKYDGKGYFRMHRDQCFVRPEGDERAGEYSILTLLWYLNPGTEYEGCRTHLFDALQEHALEVEPSAGGVLIFSHNILHNASDMISGTKYVLRTDIMYSEHEPS